MLFLRSFFVASVFLFSPIASNAKILLFDQLIDVNNNTVSFNVESQESLDVFQDWVSYYVPVSVKFLCESKYCDSAIKFASSLKVPVDSAFLVSRNSIVLHYSQKLRHSCPKRDYLGCSVADNMLNTASDLKQYSLPNQVKSESSFKR